MKKQCQSCGLMLQSKRTGDMRGTEAGGSLSEKWCKLCYANGAFIGADCSLQEMIAIVDEALTKQGANPVMKWMAKKQLPKLERWR